MSASPSSPPQTPVTILDETHTTHIEPALRSADTITAQPHHDTTSSSSQPLALPTHHVSSSYNTAINTTTSMTAIHSQVQPNYPSQNLAMANISTNNTSCLILPEPAASVHRDQSLKVSSQPLDSTIVAPSLSGKSRQSITPSFSFPGASSVGTYDHIFPDSADPRCAINTPSSTESIPPTSQTPNVYINGLPPHFSEQDLFALARPFGDIKSVRTFTRHVSEKPTGYGFVLFGDLDSAQMCIEGLRKYRNLHPSFSKQLHRIPGTEYAQHCAVQLSSQDESSFKSRMEKLKDDSSTNLYIEGLPLSIDEESLAALVKPYKIKSSRFFKTKLSHPPRIIAFVRLETRLSAEETIERLHGRMVRGWNDPGCRISVRFADSTEQRELRRAERTLKNGDQSPSRLTIAQAALLNLRGQELQRHIRNPVGCKTQRFVNSRPDNQVAFSPTRGTGLLPTSRSLPSKLCYPYKEPPLLAASDIPASSSEMDTLLQSMQHGYEDGVNSTLRSLALDNEDLMTRQAQLRALTTAALLSHNPLPIAPSRGHAQARNGFTPTEELILEAHAQRLHLQPGLSQSSPTFEPVSTWRKADGIVQTFGSATQDPLPPLGLVGKGTLYQDTLPTISEDEFHAMGHPIRSFAPTAAEFRGLFDSCPPNVPCTPSTVFVPPPSRAVSIVPPPPDHEEPEKPKTHHRSTERSIGSKQISCPPSAFHNRQSTLSTEREPRPSLPQPSTRPNGMNNCRGGSEQRSTIKEGLKSPAVLSPALTYSSRTPSTLSPATPFFGSFVGGQDAFEVMTIENEEVAERTLKARVANK